MGDFEGDNISDDFQRCEANERFDGDWSSDNDDFDDSKAAVELMQCKLLLNEYHSSLLRIPMIKLYFTQRDKRCLPFEARLLPFSCGLPKQMTRGPFILGEGRVLRRVDEDPNEELFNFEEEDQDSTTMLKVDSNETILSDPERKETEAAYSVDDMNEQWKSHPLDTIYEASTIDERIFDYPLTRSQRKIIPESQTRLPGIAEVRRIHEMAEELVVNEDELDARIWESYDTTFYCKKMKKLSNCE